MNSKFFSLSALFLFAGALPATALPLQEGVYRIGSKYIQIAAKGDRICYEGRSANGATISSMVPHPKYPDFFLLNFSAKDNTREPLVLHQSTLSTLFFGTAHNLNQWEEDMAVPRDQSDRLQHCLNSNGNFLEEVGRLR